MSDDYVAWCRYINYSGAHPTRIVLCDSDDPGAFKVYRSADARQPDSGFTPITQLTEEPDALRLPEGESQLANVLAAARASETYKAERAALEAHPSQAQYRKIIQRTAGLDDDISAGPVSDRVGAMVDRFLSCRLPATFSPDCGISFNKEVNGGQRDPNSHWWPVGTNLFTAVEARQMIEHLLASPPAAVQRIGMARLAAEQQLSQERAKHKDVEADARRYRWLRNRPTWEVYPGAAGIRWAAHFETEADGNLDAAIDSAIAAQEGK